MWWKIIAARVWKMSQITRDKEFGNQKSDCHLVNLCYTLLRIRNKRNVESPRKMQKIPISNYKVGCLTDLLPLSSLFDHTLTCFTLWELLCQTSFVREIITVKPTNRTKNVRCNYVYFFFKYISTIIFVTYDKNSKTLAAN